MCAKLCVISMHTRGGRVEGVSGRGARRKGAALMSDKKDVGESDTKGQNCACTICEYLSQF